MFNRFKSLLPRWFGNQTPVLDALLQTRLQTATGGWLDLIAADFFGDALKRGPAQSDAAFRPRIRARLSGERATRAGLTQALDDLTGREPRVFEPQRIMDTGCYRGPRLAYGLQGGYGSRQRAYQCFVTAYRPRIAGLPFVAGYRIPCGAYKTPSRAAYARRSGLTDADIVDAVNHVKPVGATVWIRFR